MKRAKDKYIRLTEKQLNNIIQVEVKKQIDYLIKETEPRRNFIERVKEDFYPIMQSWCLARYYTLTNTDINDCRHRFRSKLALTMNALANVYIESEIRHNAVVEAFEDAGAFKGVEYNYEKVKCWFYVENIDRNDKNIFQAVSDFCNDVNTILEMIARQDHAGICDYAFNI